MRRRSASLPPSCAKRRSRHRGRRAEQGRPEPARRREQAAMAAKQRGRKQARGFTLVEALIALVIFGLITFALSMSISVALRAQTVSTERQQDTGEVRAIFGQLNRDLNAASGSLNNPASAFIAGGSQGGRNATGSGLLTLTTLSHRIEADDLAGGNPVTTAAPPPQSDCA